MHPRDPTFRPIGSMMSRFWVTAQFWEKCTEWPQNDLDMFKVKDIYMHNIYIHEAQIFVSFYDESFSRYLKF